MLYKSKQKARGWSKDQKQRLWVKDHKKEYKEYFNKIIIQAIYCGVGSVVSDYYKRVGGVSGYRPKGVYIYGVFFAPPTHEPLKKWK